MLRLSFVRGCPLAFHGMIGAMSCTNALRKGGRPLLGLGVARGIASSRGGVCLSDGYEDSTEKLSWQCIQGHEWRATLDRVQHGRTWCPHCYGNARRSLGDAIAAAAPRGGRCLSELYMNCATKMSWQCSEGHEWMATRAVFFESRRFLGFGTKENH